MSDPALYTECTPIDIDGEDMVEAVVLSDLDKRDKNNAISTVQHFFIFIICILFSSMLTPFLFNRMKFGAFFKAVDSNSEEPSQSSILQIFIIILFLIYSISIATSSSNLVQTTVGSFLFIYVLLSSVIMYFLKTVNPAKYKLQITDEFSFGTVRLAIGGGLSVLSGIITAFSSKQKKSSLWWLYIFNIIISFLISGLFVPK